MPIVCFPVLWQVSVGSLTGRRVELRLPGGELGSGMVEGEFSLPPGHACRASLPPPTGSSSRAHS